MATSGSTVIRVFLSSTFVDFQEERSLLVKQVFPSLRRRARTRGVDIVDVDLRWGVTAEQTERGETLPLCLAEIDRCRPYFISLLGERYGWVPPADPTYYKPALLERQPWLQERMGAASLTELEILHSVLRNPEMAGHAFFYLRDPAYAQAQSEPGWVADHPAEQHRLNALKEAVRRSGFPVCEGLATPKAIAERIEADLWAVIEREHPEQEPLDPLQREAQRHNDYRRARTGLYLGGETAIAQLERWIEAGEQRILITGESGAGKSQSFLAVMGLLAGNASVSGSARLGETELLGNDREALNAVRGSKLAMIFQDPMTSLTPHLRVVDQIGESLVRHRGLSKAQARQRALELLRLVQVTDAERRLDQYPHELSGGMRQRVMIAIALACEPEILFADEPTTALDVTVQAQVLELMGEFRQRLGMAMVIITHDLGVVATHTDKIAVMYGGEVVEIASTKDLFANMRHPYTEALMKSIPRLDRAPGERMPAIAGTPPDPVAERVGCAFAARCSYATDKCHKEHPELTDAGNGHSYRCFFPLGAK